MWEIRIEESRRKRGMTIEVGQKPRDTTVWMCAEGDR
jgi:hypothetical protein